MIDQQTVISAFCDALAGYGVAVHDTSKIRLTGKWERARIEGDRSGSANLSYRIFYDDTPAGYFEDHKRGFSGTFSVRNGVDMDPEAREAARKAWAVKQAAREIETERAQARAAATAAEMFEKGILPGGFVTPYLTAKNLEPTAGIRADQSGNLLIPLYAELGGPITSLQTISPDGDKLYLPRGRTQGCFHPINGTPSGKARVLVCEGYATGVALAAATGHSVACAMSAGQIKAVADYFAGRFADREIVVMADNDHVTERKTGKNPGLIAALESGYPAHAPQFDPDTDWSDWQDWLALDPEHGAERLRRILADPAPVAIVLDTTSDPPPDTTTTRPPAAEHEPERPAVTDSDQAPHAPVESLPESHDSGSAELADEGIDGESLGGVAEGEDTPATPDAPASRPRAVAGRVIADIAERSGTYDQGRIWQDMNLVMGANNVPMVTLDNICRVLSKHPECANRIWFDEFQQRIMTDWRTPDSVREITNADYISLTKFMQRGVGLHKCASTTVREAVADTAMLNPRNELTEWFDSLVWDGAERLKYIMSIGFGADHNDYTEAVGRTWIHGMVARGYSPGCKVDTMPVFEGAQGEFKSTALAVLVGERWFAETGKEVTHNDFFMALQGKLLIEISELDTFGRSTVESVKRVMSCRVDRFRAPYAFKPEDHPRMSVFSGTANKNDWNLDPTGARRFYPIACGKVDIKWIAKYREQLFAEAVALFRAGEPWWNVPKDDAKREQKLRRPDDSWIEPLTEYLHGRTWATMANIMEDGLKIKPADQTIPMQHRVGGILVDLGWEKKTQRVGSTTRKAWKSPDADELL